MYNHIGAQAQRYDSHNSYRCPQNSKYPKKCTMHYIKVSALRTLVLDTIKAVSGFVKENEAEFTRIVRDEQEASREETIKDSNNKAKGDELSKAM